jgi:hypothetical protein
LLIHRCTSNPLNITADLSPHLRPHTINDASLLSSRHFVHASFADHLQSSVSKVSLGFEHFTDCLTTNLAILHHHFGNLQHLNCSTWIRTYSPGDPQRRSPPGEKDSQFHIPTNNIQGSLPLPTNQLKHANAPMGPRLSLQWSSDIR